MSLEQLCQLERELQEKIQRHDETLMKQWLFHGVASRMQTEQMEMLRRLDALRGSLTARTSYLILTLGVGLSGGWIFNQWWLFPHNA